MTDPAQLQIAEKVKYACIQAAKEGFQNASMSGLCAEGAMEAAISAIQNLKLDKVIDEERQTHEK